MVIVCFCVDDMGQYLGNTTRIKNSMFERMTSLWFKMAEEGWITKVTSIEDLIKGNLFCFLFSKCFLFRIYAIHNII